MAELDKNLRRVEEQMEKPQTLSKEKTKKERQEYFLQLDQAYNSKLEQMPASENNGCDPLVSNKLSSRRQHHKHQILNFDSSDSTSVMSMNKKVIVDNGQAD